jgi:hypothetical protein
MSKPDRASDPSQTLRCRRFVGNRPGARDGECGLVAKLIIEGQPVCYVHTPVAYRRAVTSGRGPIRSIAKGDPALS